MAVAQVIATCIMLAAQTYNVPPAVLVGILEVEGGRVGQAVRNTNGTYDLGPMQINTVWMPELSKKWRIPEGRAKKIVRDDACTNVHVAAWILRQRINDSGDLTMGIAHYHSRTPRHGHKYARKVIGAMKRLNLIAD